ncbi:MAG: tetratricopeptide repeat protein [Clostridia bacterium]|nr:tetratricopeptide repeat protein [Clostridia bacterium]
MSPLFFVLLLLLAGALVVRLVLNGIRGAAARPTAADTAPGGAAPEPGDAEPREPDVPDAPEDPLDAIDWGGERDSRAWQELAEAFEAAGRPEEAARALQSAVDALEEDQADRGYELHQELAALYLRRQSPHEAYKHLSAASACAVMCFGSPSAQQVKALNAMADLLEEQGSWAKAYAKYHEAMEAEQALYGVPASRIAAAHISLARMCERLADWPEALEHYLEAYRITGGEAALEDVRRAYLADGRDAEAFEEWLNR